MSEAVLTFNAGSSSLKCALFEIAGDRPKLLARAEIAGLPVKPQFIAKDRAGAILLEQDWRGDGPDYSALVAFILEWSRSHLGKDRLKAVGHRVVHGGGEHVKPEPVTPLLLDDLERLVPLAPLHQPHSLAPIRTLAALQPDLQQVACFDTGFHAAMPPLARRFALPRRYEAEGLRRYGFHGLSYEYIALRLREVAPELAAGRVIVAHLGNGASLCAMEDGRSVDTTMSFSALDGLVMGTRPGTLDPGVLLYLERQQGLRAQALESLLYHECGLLGVSGISSDMRTLLESGENRAKEAIALFVYRLVSEMGALAAILGGLDGVVFTAGIGEHAAPVRAMACARLAFLGLTLDGHANARHAPLISAPKSRVAVRVIPTDEEEMIARHTIAIAGPAP